jgi:UPF0755 protein
MFDLFVSGIELHAIRWWRNYLVLIGAILIFIVFPSWLFFSPPAQFPVGAIVTIPTGSSIRQAAEILRQNHIIKNEDAFIIVELKGGNSGLIAGPYLFTSRQNACVVAGRLAAGDSGIAPIKVTITEGETVQKMSEELPNKLPLITQNEFVSSAKAYQGYLFPDTYLLPPNETTNDLIALMRKTFDTQIVSISSTIRASGHSLSDIVIMASILEGETNTPQDRRIVSGILWKRLNMGMPLQVDAAPDTYQHQGLPAAPINNPGLDALAAAATPTKTSYLYYLTGTDGKMHYASTFAQHQTNQQKYLK